MNHIAVAALLLVLVRPCAGQQFQIVRPDSTVFKSISINQYVSVVTTAHERFDGQLTRITTDAVTINHKGQLVDVPVREITKAKKTSKVGIRATRASLYAAVVPILILPSANSPSQQDKTFAGRFLVPAAIIIPSAAALGLLMNAPSFKKAKKGYSFRIVH